jgi:hypothetical protein
LFAIPLGDIIVFGVLVGAATLQRHDSDKHKRLMLLATISLLTAAVARFLRQVGMGGAPNLFYGTDVFVVVLAIYDLVSRGRVHPATLWGGAAVVDSHCCSTRWLSHRRGWLSPTLCVFRSIASIQNSEVRLACAP